jgi:zinc-ribbon domain
MRCPSCTAPNQPGASFCSECGEKMPGSVVKKPVRPAPQPEDDDDEEAEVVAVAPKRRRVRRRDEDEDDDDYESSGDGGIGTLIPYRNPKALAAYYLGIFSLIPVIGIVPAPIALVLGILGVRAARADSQAKGTLHAILGIVFGALALMCYVPLTAWLVYARANKIL